MTIDDYTGLSWTIADLDFRHADRHIAAARRMLPGRNTRRVIGVEIIRRRGIGDIGEADIAKAIDREQGLPPGAQMPAGNAQQVPDQPWPEERPDKLEKTAEIRMHAREDEPRRIPGG